MSETSWESQEWTLKMGNLPTIDRWFGSALNEILQFTSLYTPLFLKVNEIDFSTIPIPEEYKNELIENPLNDKEKEILQLCTNEFTKIPTNKYAIEIKKRMFEWEICRWVLIIIFNNYIIPEIRKRTGFEDKIK